MKKVKKEKFRNKLFKLHEQNVTWLTELEFAQDEHIFLENLLSTYFLDLSSEKLFEPTKKLIHKLNDVEIMDNELEDAIQTHNKHVATLLESLQLEGKKDVVKEHQSIKKDFDIFHLKFKFVKKKIYNMIKEIMKEHKQKLLISNP
ncbi:MAG: hypothetical protein J7K34_03645 [Flavobacteriaceae bacterium]|nr:hypothetical protein [Flavobacteriaceae bacterium]